MEGPLYRLLISSRFINKHGHHRQFLFLIGRFFKISSFETARPNKPKLIIYHTVGTEKQTYYTVGTEKQTYHTVVTEKQIYYTVGTEKQIYHTVGTEKQIYHNVGTEKQIYHTVGTVPKSNGKS